MKSPSKPAPQYNAYTPVIVHDGLTQHLTHHFDNTREMTPGDLHMAKQMFKSLSPSARIQAMQDRLGTLKRPTKEIAMHISAIKEIHAALTAKGQAMMLTSTELDSLDYADRLWKSILVLRGVTALDHVITEQKMGAKRKEKLLTKAKQKTSVNADRCR